MSNEVITSYKGFNPDMTCRGFQYEVGKTYETDKAVPCECGFHACANPLDVLDYYNDVDGKYCIVEQSGEIVENKDKVASTKIHIKADIGFVGLFKAGIEWLKEVTLPIKVKDSTLNDNGGNSAQIGSSGYSAQIGSSGNYAQIGSSGNSAQIGSSGNYAKIGSSGNYAKIGSSGDYAVICCAGHGSQVKAKKGSWITFAEWSYSEELKKNIPVCVKTEQVDGERIKEDTWYMLKNGEFVECERD